MASKLPTLIGKFTTRKPLEKGYVGPRALKILAQLSNNGPSTQEELLSAVRPAKTMFGDRVTKKSRWGNSYFMTKPGPFYPQFGGNGYRASLIARGLVINTGVKQGRSFLYAITPKGLALLAGMF